MPTASRGSSARRSRSAAGQNELATVRSTRPWRRSAEALAPVPRALDVGVQSDFDSREKLERLLQGRQLRRELPELGQPQRPDPAGGDTVADLEEIVRVGEDERTVVEVENVELDEVHADLDRAPERRKGVLGPQRRGASMGDSQRASTASKLRQVLRMTTTAQSSVRSPPVKARQSSTTARASSAAGRLACAASRASSRSSP